MKVTQKLIPSSKHSIKSPFGMTAEYITIHNTYNDASAQNEVSYMTTNSNQVSFHVAIDDKTILQAIPFNRIAWHCGDGRGNGNMKSIGLEICYSKSGGTRYKQAEQNTIDYVAELLYEFGWNIDRVKKHEDWSGKFCPHRILSEKRWDSFKQDINLKLAELKGGNDVTSVYSPGSVSLINKTEEFLTKAISKGIINKSHLEDFKAGKLTTDRLLGLKILIDLDKDKG